jgi:glucokinase
VDELQERLGLPVAVDNDANLAALAEHLHGAARHARHSLLLTLGTGVGGGIIIDDQVFRGATGAGAELGHVSVERDGPPCPGGCPNRGCLEVYASGPGIGLVARQLGLTDPEPRSVNDRALAGDPAALAVLHEVGRTLGVALASFANVFDPEIIVLGGGVSAHVGQLLLPVAVVELRARALRPNADQVQVVLAELGPDAGLIGAGDLARLEAAKRC